MPANTKFTITDNGRIVYRSTGKAAPSNYFIDGGTVYKEAKNSVGRVKVGTVATATLKAKEVKRIERAQKSKVMRTRYVPQRSKVKVGRKQRSVLADLKGARTVAAVRRKTVQTKLIATNDQVRNLETAVHNMALNVEKADRELYLKIQKMEGSKLYQMYNENDLIFEVYFDYGDVSQTSDGNRGGKVTRENAAFLVSQYEKRYGEIKI